MRTWFERSQPAGDGQPQAEASRSTAVHSTEATRIEIVHGRDGWLELPHTTAWVDGMVLYSVTVAAHNDGWRAMLKATRRDRYYVTFVNDDTWLDCLEGVLSLAESGILCWYDDKYPPK